VLAISAIGDPRAFHRQLEAAGAAVDAATFGDHHAFSRADVTSLVARASRAEVAVCTLKDAVKLWPLWPRGAAPLWYVSQHVTVEIGAAALDASLDLLVPNSGR
jgi:tetraacyldisaccharide 4'-kinase